MNIYFACSITGGREFEVAYQALVRALQADGHHIPTSHLAESEIIHEEQVIEPQTVFTRDIAWINAVDAVVAEVSTPSHGVGYEIAYALGQGKPVLCLYQQGRIISKMLTGNTLPKLRIAPYHDIHHAIALARTFLKHGPIQL